MARQARRLTLLSRPTGDVLFLLTVNNLSTIQIRAIRNRFTVSEIQCDNMDSFTSHKAGVTITVGDTISGMRITGISERATTRNVYGLHAITVAVQCGACGARNEISAKALLERVHHNRSTCSACKSTGHGRPAQRHGCRVCDDCPALRPATGCPGCGEMPVRRAS